MGIINLDILPQPDDESCGATCLHALYRFYGEDIDLLRLSKELSTLDTGGTLAVILGTHALEKGYKATIFTYNLHVFDPSWFLEGRSVVKLKEKITSQMQFKKKPKLHWASKAYMKFIDRGGKIKFEELNASLLRRYLKKGIPLLTGLNATYLYRWPREVNNEFDDIRGLSMGHFVILNGYDRFRKEVLIADPLRSNPFSNQTYKVSIDRVVNSIMLGILTYDANFLVIEKKTTK